MNGERSWFWTLIIGLIYVAILYVLVKPGSDGANAVTGLANALSSLVATATGGTPATGGNTNVGA